MSDPGNTAATVEVSLLQTGEFYLFDHWILEGGKSSTKTLYPDYSFFIYHPPSKTSLIFDLGLRRDITAYPSATQKAAHTRLEFNLPKTAGEILKENGISPEAIRYIVYSHLHWDHVGDPSEFPNSEIIVGPGSQAAAFPGYPVDPDSEFVGVIFSHPLLRELSYEVGKWVKFGPFEKAYDFFDDGSFLLLDAPGHMAGNIVGLARTGQEEYVALGGDCCHHRNILTGEGAVSTAGGPHGRTSMHTDLGEALRTIDKLRELQEREDTLVCLAHDWFLEPSVKPIPARLNGWRKRGLKKEIREYSLTAAPTTKPV